MPNFGVEDFDAIRANLERIKKEKGEANGVDINNSSNPAQEGTLGYPATAPEPIYMGCTSSDPTQTEAYRRYYANPVVGWGSLTQGQGWREYLLSPIKSRFSYINDVWASKYSR